MTIDAETARSGPYTGNGSTTVFAYGFKALVETHLIVTQTVIATGVETIKTLTTHYTVSGVGSDGGGNVTMLVAPPTTATLTITRGVPLTQTTDLVNRAAVVPTTLETAFDRGVQQVQDLNALLVRTLKLPVSVDTGTVSTEIAVPAANAYLIWNATATALTSTGNTGSQFLAGDGTVALPFYSFSSDPDCGLYRIGANNIGFSVNASKIVDYATTGVSVTGTITSSGTIVASAALTVATTSTLTGVTTHGGNVVSDTDSTDDLGTTGVRWANLYVDAVTITDDQTVGGNLIITGNLTVNGTTVTQNADNLLVEDPLIELNTGAASNANDLGLLMERGSTGDNVFVGWDESGDFFLAGTTTATGSSTGDITYTLAQAQFAGLTLSGTSSNLGTVTTVNIDGGTVDGAVIGGASPAAITGTTLTGSTSLVLATGATVTGIADEDDMVSNSATLLATQQSIKAYSDSNAAAPGLPMTWEADTDAADKGDGRVWLNHATPASATLMYFDDNLNNGTTDISALIAKLDDATATNSATISIHEGGNGGAFIRATVNGSVTDLTTHSSVAITDVVASGSFADSDVVGVTLSFSGDNGGGMANVVEDVTPQLGGFLDPNGQYIGMAKGGDIASASPLVIDTDGDMFDVTGTTAFSAMTVAANRHFILQWDDAVTVTHGASLKLPGAANITTAAGDVWTCFSTAADTVIVTNIATAASFTLIPQVSKSTAYTTVLTDTGGHVLHPTADNNARTFTIDSNANVAYPIGTAITFINQINTVTIAITSDTLTLYPAGTTGSRTLAAYGQATAIKVASTSWVITGVGLT